MTSSPTCLQRLHCPDLKAVPRQPGRRAARNLLEGRPRYVLAMLDALAGSGEPARMDLDSNL